MSLRISDFVAEKIEQAVIKATRPEDDVFWDVSIVPGPNGSPAAYLAFIMPGAVLGSQLTAPPMLIQNPNKLSKDEAEKLVNEALTMLRKAQSEQVIEGVSRDATIVPQSIASGGAVLLG